MYSSINLEPCTRYIILYHVYHTRYHVYYTRARYIIPGTTYIILYQVYVRLYILIIVYVLNEYDMIAGV